MFCVPFLSASRGSGVGDRSGKHEPTNEGSRRQKFPLILSFISFKDGCLFKGGCFNVILFPNTRKQPVNYARPHSIEEYPYQLINCIDLESIQGSINWGSYGIYFCEGVWHICPISVLCLLPLPHVTILSTTTSVASIIHHRRRGTPQKEAGACTKTFAFLHLITVIIACQCKQLALHYLT